MSELPFFDIDDIMLNDLYTDHLNADHNIYVSVQELEDLDIHLNETSDRFFGDQNDIDPDKNLFSQLQNNCTYLQPETIITNISATKFNILELNIRSFPKNFDNFILLFNPVLEAIDCIVITETWFTSNKVDMYNIPGFKSVHNYRVRKRGGGVSIYIRDNIMFTQIQTMNILNPDFEFVFIKIKKKYVNLTKDLVLGACYRPPNANVQNFIDKMEEIIDHFGAKSHFLYIAGDFNLDLLKLSSKFMIQMCLDLMVSSALLPLITKPTRFTPTSVTLIDNIFTNNFSNAHDSYMIICDISDHFPLITSIETHTSIKINDYYISRCLSKRNFNKFAGQCSTENWNVVLNYNDTQLAYSAMDAIIQRNYTEWFPLQRRCKNYKIRLPWVSLELKTKIKQKNKLYKLSIKQPTQLNFIKYKQFRRTLNRELHKAKRDYYNKKMTDSRNNKRKCWTYIKELIGKEDTIHQPDYFLVDHSPITDNNKIANGFNNFFINVGATLAENIEEADINYMHYLNNPNPNCLFLEPTNTSATW